MFLELIFAISILSCNVKVLKLQAAIKYGEEDLQGAKVHKNNTNKIKSKQMSVFRIIISRHTLLWKTNVRPLNLLFTNHQLSSIAMRDRDRNISELDFKEKPATSFQI